NRKRPASSRRELKLFTPQKSKPKADARDELEIISSSSWSDEGSYRVTTCRWIETKTVMCSLCKMNYGVSHIKARHDSAGRIEFKHTTNVQGEVVDSFQSYFKRK